jgi:hypothetical protein
VEDRPRPDRRPASRPRRVETLIAQLRQVNSDVLAVATELSHCTIETVLARSDLQLGMEALLRRPPA